MAPGAVGEHRRCWQWAMAWGCPSTEAPVPSPNHLSWLGGWGAGAAHGGSLYQAAPCPSKAGSQACAPWEPRGSITLTLAPIVGASPLAGVPCPSEQNSPPCVSNPGWQNHSWALPVLARVTAAWPGRAGCFVESLPGSRLFTLQPPFPNRSVHSTLLLLVNSFLSIVGWLFPGQ